MNYIYADHAATTATSPAAREAMNDCMENFYGNPSSLHTVGQKAAVCCSNVCFILRTGQRRNPSFFAEIC